MNVGDLVLLPERMLNSPFPDLNEDLAKPGRIASVGDGWALVEFEKWGQFGCAVVELRPA